MSRRREQALVEVVLRDQVQIDPDNLGAVLDLAAVGIVNGAWRNSPVEDWHGQGRLHDGDMLRINAHTSWRVREIVRRWRGDLGLGPQSLRQACDGLDSDATDWLAERIWRWLVNPARRLPTGATLAELAGSDLNDYRDHADEALGGFAAMVEERGALYAFWRAAAHGGLACRHWWGTPAWPALVDRFMHALDTPDHPHWSFGRGWQVTVQTAPHQATGRAGLRRLLMSRPWALNPDTAQWVVDAGIGFLLERVPQLADDIHEALPH